MGFEIVQYNQYNLQVNAKMSTCPLCSDTRKKSKDKCLSIDWEKGFICLPAEIPKERKPKNIPMNHHVRETLKSLPHALHHDYVFTYKGEPIRDRGGLKRSFRTACKKADIPCGRNTPDGIIFHDIRRTVKTNMLNAGVNQVHRDLILGHSLQGMDAHYLVPNEDDLQREMDLYTR